MTDLQLARLTAKCERLEKERYKLLSMIANMDGHYCVQDLLNKMPGHFHCGGDR
jgi:hypothetical protein